jgi:hypothetical protein
MKTRTSAALLLVVCMVLALLLSLGRADTSRSVGLNGGTNNVAAKATNYYTGSDYVMSLSGHRLVSVQPVFSMFSAGATSNVVFLIDVSLDATNWFTNFYTLAIAGNGTTAAFALTNYDFGAIQYLRWGGVRNTNEVAATNLAVWVGFKPGL